MGQSFWARIGDENTFFADFEQVLPAATLDLILVHHGPRRRCPPRLRGRELLVGLVYHVSQGSGRLGAHLQELMGKPISEAAASERRLAMPWEVFAAILAQALVPLADSALPPEAFYPGERLVGIDGTQFSCANTPRMLGTMTRAAIAMVARGRLQVAGAAALRVSFGRTLAALQPLWLLLNVGGDLLSASQQRAFVACVLRPLVGQGLLPKRRALGCPRTVRQPIKGWPRTTNTHVHKGDW